VAALIKGMATPDTFYSQPACLKESEFLESFQRISRTGGKKPASIRRQ